MPTIEEIINIGFSNHQIGRFEEAEHAYQEALKLDCENAEVCNLIGVLKLQQNDPDSAIDWVEKAINLSPSEYYYETLFQAYIRAGFYDRIIECEKTILKNYPKSFSLLFNIAFSGAHRGLHFTAFRGRRRQAPPGIPAHWCVSSSCNFWVENWFSGVRPWPRFQPPTPPALAGKWRCGSKFGDPPDRGTRSPQP